jgi:DNA polymerase-3 subunit chi
MLGSEERVEAVNNLLWTYNDRGFLPHGSSRDGFPADQPIWLTDKDENPNKAEILLLGDGARSGNVGSYGRCFELFDGNDPEAVASARLRWKQYTEAGHQATYWQQSPAGKWEKK